MSDRRIPFTPEDEDRIASASLWGIIAAVTGVVSTLANTAIAVMHYLQIRTAFPQLASIRQVVTQAIALVVSLMLGTWLIQACTSFRAVARTDVADKAYLLRGFDKLYAYFLTIGVVMIVLLVLLVVAFVLFFLFRPRMAGSFRL